MIFAMKLSRAGNVSVILLVGLGCLIIVAGLIYVYHRDFRRSPEVTQQRSQVASGSIVQRVYHRPKVVRPLVPPEWHPSLEPTFKIIGPAGGRKIIQKVMPSFTRYGRKKGGFSTQVQLAFRVNDEGGVAPNVWVTKMGYPDFDAAAVQALRQWKFEPLDHPVPLPPEPNVVKDVERGQPAVIDFTFKLIKPPVRI